MVGEQFEVYRVNLDLVSILDLERLGNPGWNWKNYDKYVARTERLESHDTHVFSVTYTDTCFLSY
jgi:hypothetical protein